MTNSDDWPDSIEPNWQTQPNWTEMTAQQTVTQTQSQ